MKRVSLFKFCLILLFPLLSNNIYSQEVSGRDPTRPSQYTSNVSEANKSATPRVGYNLQSVIIGKTRRLALINDKFVTVGDVIGNAKVIAISRNTVVLSESGKKVTIYLFERGIRN